MTVGGPFTLRSDGLPSPRRLSLFTGRGYDKGRGRGVCAAWVTIGQPITRSVLCPASARVWILRAFGAEIGPGVLIRHDVTIHWPWKLSVGCDSWIGAGAWLLNLEPITIGSDVCVSQWALLCTGSHRWDDPAFEFDNAPIVIEDGAWIAARSTVLRGVTIGHEAVVGAGAVVARDVPPGSKVFPTPNVVRMPGDLS
jgi:putative colanic acid biosynthesis acetyltransferase WcaF